MLPVDPAESVLFAHRGASAHAPENTLEAFELAVRLGATGIESDAWVTRDGVAVLDHDGLVGPRLRRRSIDTYRREELPAHIPSIGDLYERIGSGLPLSIDVKDHGAFGALIDAAGHHGAVESLWLCHDDVEVLASWRTRSPDVRLVHSTFVGHLPHGCERHAAVLRQAGIDAVNLHHSEWNPGRIALYRRFGRKVLAWDAQHTRVISQLLRWRVDGLYSDHVDRMSDAAAALFTGDSADPAAT